LGTKISFDGAKLYCSFKIGDFGLAAETGLLADSVVAVAKTFQAQHGQHASKIKETITSLGGEPVKPLSTQDYAQKLPSNLTSQESILKYALNLEKSAAITFLNAVPEFENHKIAQAAASILGDEAMHWAVLRNALGLTPVHISFIPMTEDEVED
jgi:bacterioferritin (cytochrome b1)